MKKNESTPVSIDRPLNDRSQSTGLAAASLVLVILSLTGFGLILGIPAIITGILALRRSDIDRGLSWTGIITGAISTVISLLVMLLFVILFIFALMSSQEIPEYYEELPEETVPVESA